MIRRALLAWFSVFAIMSMVGCETISTADAIRVGTYNIRLSAVKEQNPVDNWVNRRRDVVEQIRRMKLDVFGIQEVCPDQAEYLRSSLPEFDFVGEHRESDRKSGEASPVCYRRSRFSVERSGTFWLSETPDVPGVRSWGAACPRVCSYLVLRDRRTGKVFCFANTHTDHVSARAREKGMLLVVERMKMFGAGAPIVFVGDHNCREFEAPAVAVSTVLGNALYLSETTPSGAWRTYNGWEWRKREVTTQDALAYPVDVRNERSGSSDVEKMAGKYGYETVGPRIDYIYVSKGIRVCDYVTCDQSRPGLRRYPSDHFPVVATIEIP